MGSVRKWLFIAVQLDTVRILAEKVGLAVASHVGSRGDPAAWDRFHDVAGAAGESTLVVAPVPLDEGWVTQESSDLATPTVQVTMPTTVEVCSGVV